MKFLRLNTASAALLGLFFSASISAAQAISDAELQDAILVCGRHSIGKDPVTQKIIHEPGWENCQALREEEKMRKDKKAAVDRHDAETKKPIVDDLAKRLKSGE